ILLACNLETYRIVWAGHNLVGNVLDFRLHFRVAASDKAFGRVNGVFRVENRLTFSDLTDQSFAGFGEGDNRGGQPAALAINHHGGLSALHDGDYRVRSAEVYSYCLCHNNVLLRIVQVACFCESWQRSYI